MSDYTYKVASSIEDDSRMKLLKQIDLESYFNENNITLSTTLSSYINITNEHYHFLAYLSTLFHDSKIIDTGTHRGGSALALSYNQSNKIYTYDIEPFKGGIKGNVQNIPDNIISNDNTNIAKLIDSSPNDILDSQIFFLDINHEGPDELKIFDFLLSNNYTGILVLDDIHLNAQMRDVWNYIQTKDVVTYDMTKYGHSLGGAGTGIVIFDNMHSCVDTFDRL